MLESLVGHFISVVLEIYTKINGFLFIQTYILSHFVKYQSYKPESDNTPNGSC